MHEHHIAGGRRRAGQGRFGKFMSWLRSGHTARLEVLEDRNLLAVFNIADGDTTALVAAINTANSNDQADIIRLASSGTFTLTAPVSGNSGLEITADNNDPTNRLTIAGNGATIERSSLTDFRILAILDGAVVTIDQVTLSGGNLPADLGGGLFNAGDLTLTNSTIATSTASAAGGGGGGLYSSGVATIVSSTFTGNTTASSGAGGGGILNDGGTMTITASQIAGNSSDVFGGGVLDRGLMTITTTTIAGNNATEGAGLFNSSVSAGTSIDRSTLSGNTALGNGGGIASRGFLAGFNSTLSGNIAGGAGGGLMVTNDRAELMHVTVTGNTAISGGGVQVGGSLEMLNSIVAGNSAPSGVDVMGTVDSTSAYNLVGNSAGMTGISDGVDGNQIGTPGNPLDARLGVLSHNGGPTQTHALLPDSTAINSAALGAAIDQRGLVRPSGGAADIGAFEFQEPLSLTAVGGAGQSAVVNSTFADSLEVRLTEGGGAPIAGVTVTFTAPAPSITFPGGNTAITDSQGRASVPVTAGIIAGNYAVTASIAGLGAAATFNLTNTPGASAAVTPFSGTSQSALAFEDFASPLQARVTDAFGNPLSGVSVAFEAPSLGPSGDFAGSTTVATDAAGIATAPHFTANEVAGTYLVTASVSGVATPASFSLTNLPLVDLAIWMTNDTLTSMPGTQTVYTIEVENFGPSDAPGTLVEDIFPAALTNVTWIAFTDGGALAPFSGSGNISTHVDLPAGSSVTFIVTADILPAAWGVLVNFATVTAAPGVTEDCSCDNLAADIDLLPAGLLVAGPGPGALGMVRVFSAATGAELYAIEPYAGFTGGVQVATGDVNGDGLVDIITAPGAGMPPRVRAFNGATGTQLAGPIGSFLAYEEGFQGGVFVAAADLDGDGLDDVVTGAGTGGGPHVRVFDGATGAIALEFFAYEAAFTGGVRVATGDFDCDCQIEIITAAGPGGGPHVRVFDGTTGAQFAGPIGSFYAYGANFGGGVYVASGEVNGDGIVDLVTGAGAGAGPHVRVFDGDTGEQLPGEIGSFYAYNPLFGGGVRVATADINGDGQSEVVTAAGPAGGPHVRVFEGPDASELFGFFAYNASFGGGVYIAGSPVTYATFPLRLDGHSSSNGQAITQRQLDDLAAAAIDGWRQAGLSAAGTAYLDALTVRVADLPGNRLSQFSGHEIVVDASAAGRGWYVDPTPADDSEFDGDGAAIAAEALERVDLLTALWHEFGHALGLDHQGSTVDLMASHLVTGARRPIAQSHIDTVLASGRW